MARWRSLENGPVRAWSRETRRPAMRREMVPGKFSFSCELPASLSNYCLELGFHRFICK
jgi:hypothetical protein